MLGYSELLKEKCSYEHYSGINKYNEKSYNPPVEVNCFTSFDFSNTANNLQQFVKVSKVIFIGSEFEPNPFDKVDGLEIQGIQPVKGLEVPVIGWEIVV